MTSAKPPPPAPAATRELWSHEFLDALVLAYYSEIARRVELNPGLVSRAQANLNRWLAGGGYSESQIRSLQEWQPLLEPQRLPDLLRVMTDSGEEATRMRQSGPFAGILTSEERRAIKENLKARWLQHGTV